jgi:hypothetical protein
MHKTPSQSSLANNNDNLLALKERFNITTFVSSILLLLPTEGHGMSPVRGAQLTEEEEQQSLPYLKRAVNLPLLQDLNPQPHNIINLPGFIFIVFL